MYDKKFRAEAVKLVKESGFSIKAVAEQKGVSYYAVWKWCQDQEDQKRKRYVHLSPDEKCTVALRFIQMGWSGPSLATEYNISISSVYNIVKEYRLKGPFAFMDKKKPKDRRIQQDNELSFEAKRTQELPNDVEELKKKCYQLELENAVLEQTIEILKKDPGADPSAMTNHEKMMVIDALKKKFSVTDLCENLAICRSSYYYAKKAASKSNSHVELRLRIRAIFEQSKQTFGSERIWNALRCGDDGQEPIRISEKVIRHLMREEGFVVIYSKKKRSYNSYKGEISAHPGNKVERNFHADKPNKLWLTDITQFTLPSYKCYLSAIIDCFDGKVVSYKVSLSPDAQLANDTLKQAVGVLNASDRPICHSDCGCHYRWPNWISLCAANNIERSMSRKACSPDNAACEGFFGRLKNEFFYYRNWENISFDEFSKRLDEYIYYYNNIRKKKSLGWLSPIGYRTSLGYAA